MTALNRFGQDWVPMFQALSKKRVQDFDPNQPRDPKGTPTGGRWVSKSGLPPEGDLDNIDPNVIEFYHGTTSTVIDSITEHGLQPNKAGTGADNWVKQNWPMVYEQEIKGRPASVFLTRKRDTAEKYVKLVRQINPNAKGVVITVRLPQEFVRAHIKPDEKSSKSHAAYRTTSAVKPEWIRGYHIFDASVVKVYAVVMVIPPAVVDAAEYDPKRKYTWEKGDIVVTPKRERKDDVADFDPNQPRDPKGTPTGGQWTRAGSSAPSFTQDPDHPFVNEKNEAAYEELVENDPFPDPSDVMEALDYMNEFMDASFDGTMSQKEADALNNYSDGQYKPMNDILRGVADPYEAADNSGYSLEEISENMKTLRATLDRASLSHDTVVYRAFGPGTLDAIRDSGGTFVDKGFTSTSHSLRSAEAMSMGVGNDVLPVFLPKGSKALPLGSNVVVHVQEREILVQAGGRYRVHRNAAGKIQGFSLVGFED